MTTQQATPDKDMNRNPSGKGGFGDHPENRNPGGWNKEESISYQYNYIMRMTPDEYNAFVPQTIAQKIAHERIKVAVTTAGLNDAKEITDRTEGKAPQTVSMTNPDGSLNPYNALTTEQLRKLADK